MNSSKKNFPPRCLRPSVAISFVVAILVFFWSGIVQISIGHRFLMAATVLPIAFGLALYYDPKLWFMRMAAATLFTLLSSQLFGGLNLTLPVPWGGGLIQIEVPGTHWTASIVLAGLTVFFTRLHTQQFRHAHSSQET